MADMKEKLNYFLEKIHRLNQSYVKPSIVLPRGQIAENDYVMDLLNLNTEMFQTIKDLAAENQRYKEALENISKELGIKPIARIAKQVLKGE